LRAILNMPLGSTDAIMPSAMVNLLGEPGHTGAAVYQGLDEVLAMQGVYPHIYGKAQVKPFRKMGHVTVIAATVEELKEKAFKGKNTLKAVSA